MVLLPPLQSNGRLVPELAPPPAPENPILNRALDLARRGLPVLPLVRGGKKPLTQHGFQDASTDPVQIRHWWTRFPDANLGLATGARSRLVVIDLDTKDGKDGLAVFAALLAPHGGTLPGCRIQTPTGGQHLYYRHPGGHVRIPCTAEVLGQGIDVRADGGYIVVPPSRTPAGVYTVLERSHVPELPAWLLARVLKSKPLTQPPAQGADPVAGDPNLELEIRAALRRLPADDYSAWLTAGMALKHWDSERGFDLWETWSKTSPKYEAGACAQKWETFSGANTAGETATAKSLLALARQADEAMAMRLARLDPATYDRVREEEAKRAGLRTSVLDGMVSARRVANDPNRSQGPIPPDPEPWSEPVEGAQLLAEMTRMIRRFLVVGPLEAEVLAVWALHTYTASAMAYTPILALLSPAKRCGKSVTLAVLAKLARRPLVTSNATPAALYRAIECWHPSLLIDEFDSHSREEVHVELRNILNSGFHRDGSVLRCEGEDNEPTPFATFCPKVVASIGDLPETAMDRAIVIRLRRKLRSEVTERLRRFDCPELRQQCARWAADHVARVQEATPALPDELNDRQQDIWEPLLAIVDLAGGSWPKALRDAAIRLAGEKSEEGIGVMLLEDVAKVFSELKAERIATVDLLEQLNGMDERPWGTFAKGQPLSAHRLGRLLKPYDIVSGTVRVGHQTAKGYCQESFTEAWNRYLAAEPSFQKGNTVTTIGSIDQNACPATVTPQLCDLSESVRNANRDGHCDDVTFLNAKPGRNEETEAGEVAF